MTRVLGLDLSLTATGVAWEGGTEVVSFPKARGAERLDLIEQRLFKQWWRYHNPPEAELPPEVAVIEGFGYAVGDAQFILELHGVVKLTLHRTHIPYVMVPPAVLKKFATGKGNVGKDEVLAAAIRRFGFEGTNNNEADAWMLRTMGLYRYEPLSYEMATDYQREALAKIEWPELESRKSGAA